MTCSVSIWSISTPSTEAVPSGADAFERAARSTVRATQSDGALLVFWKLSITEGSDYALARLTLLISKGLNELEERSALDGLCSEKHTGESEGKTAKKNHLFTNQALHFAFRK